MAELLDPALKVRCSDAVGPGKQRIPRLQQLDRTTLNHHLFRIPGKTDRIRAVVMVVLSSVVLDDEHTALLYVIEQAAVRGGKLRAGGVGPDAEHNDVIGREIAIIDIRCL